MPQKEKVVFIGRFQPFHYGHLMLLFLALSEAKGEKITVVIGSANESGTKDNPLNFEERREAIIKIADSFGYSDRIPKENIIPSNDYIGDDEKWRKELEAQIGENAIIVSNNDWTNKILKAYRHRIVTTDLVERNHFQGQILRGLIREENSEWENYIPQILISYYNKINFVEKVIKSANVIN